MKNVVMVTGAGTSLGKVIAHSLIKKNFRVVFADLSLGDAQKAAESCASPENALPLFVDIRNKASVEEALNETTKHFGELNALVNNAALTLTTNIMEIEPEEFDRVISTNLRGTFLCCQVIGTYFSNKRYGRIVNMASLAGQNGGTASGAHYAASKGGILTLTKVFARALSQYGVTVNSVAPGPIDVPSVHSLVPEDKMKELLNMIPVSHLCDPAFIGETISLLISEQAAFVTGATWDINGGIYMR